MLSRIHQWATGRNVLIFFGLDLLMMAVVMPYASTRLQEAVGEKEVLPLDLVIPTYSVEYAHQSMADYGAAGRSVYRLIELTADVIYPLIYGLAFALLIAFFWSRIAPRLRWLPLLPLAVVVFDYLENIFIVTLLSSFPDQPDGIARLAGIASLMKWSLLLPCMLLILVGLVLWLFRRKPKMTTA